MKLSKETGCDIGLSVQKASNDLLDSVADECSKEMLNACINYVGVTLLNIVAKFNTIEQIMDSIISVYYSDSEVYEYFIEDIVENTAMDFKTKANIIKTIARRLIPKEDFCMRNIDECNRIRNLFCHCRYVPIIDNNFIHIELSGKKRTRKQIEELFNKFEQHYCDSLKSLKRLCDVINLPVVID